MSLSTNISDLATRVATEVKALRTLINGNAADLSSLTTAAKTNLVAALNELKSDVDALSAGAAGIDDASTGTDSTWSSQKVSDQIAAAVTALVGGAPGALDTLNELAAALGDDASYAASITTALAGKADDSAVVKLTGAQTVAGIKTFSSSPVVPDGSFAIAKTTGLQSALDGKQASGSYATTTDVGNTATDFVATFEAGL